MAFYTEAYFNHEGEPKAGALVPDSLVSDGVNAHLIMGEIVKERWANLHPGETIGAPLVFACHEGTPDSSLLLTAEERTKYFSPQDQSSVRILGSH